MDNDRKRITPYQDLFDSISENKRIEVGLRSVLDMGDKCHPSIREMAEAVLEEIEFFRQRKRGVYYLPYKSGKTEPTVKVEMNANNICDPILLEMSQAVLEEMRYVRHQREVRMNGLTHLSCVLLTIFFFYRYNDVAVMSACRFLSFFSY